MRVQIKDFYNRVLGSIETLPNGDKIARDFYNKIVGYYFKDRDVTTDFYHTIIAHGDCVAGLIPRN